MATSTVRDEWLTAQTSDGPMGVYVARPDDDAQHPAVVVVQEIFGVDDHIRDVTRRFAAEGFVAGAPDLFHRAGPRLTLPYSDMQRGFALRQQLTDDMITEDCNAAISLLNGLPNTRRGQIGIVGFCFGGRVTYLMATRNPELKAAVSFYGGRIVADEPSAPINASANIRAPLLLFFGDQDQSIPLSQVETIRETLTRLGKPFEVHVYPGAGHGFFCDARGSYQPEAARDSWQRTLAFLRQQLGS